MTAATSSGLVEPTLAELRLIDNACDRFEDACRSGEPAELADFLAEVPESARPRLLRELMKLDLDYLRARGENPAVDAYRARFPGLEHVIDIAFALEQPGLPSPDISKTRFAGVSSSGETTVTAVGLARAALSPGARTALGEAGYVVLGELGRGGMGVVYLARKIGLNRLCAVKMILAGSHAGSAMSARFRIEAETVARLSHPDIVKIYHVGEADGLPFLELEYLPGGSLDRKLNGTPWPAAEATRLVETSARAIAEAHLHGIIHRDLKPANILLDARGRPRVADFGLAKVLGSDGGMTKTRVVIGSPSYMAPEQASGNSRDVGAATDVYALGAILYELLTGRPPFRGATELETLAQVKGTDPVPPSQIQPGLPRDAETICLKCLEKLPARRYHSANALADDLRRYLDGEPIQGRPAAIWERAFKWACRQPAMATAIAVSGAAVGLFVAGALYYNVHLQEAVGKARAAERVAVARRKLTEETLKELVFRLQDLLGEVPATRRARQGLLDTAISGLNEIATTTEGDAPNLARAAAHQKLGDIYRQIGRGEDARRMYDLSRQLGEDLAAISGLDVPLAECLGRSYLGLGKLSVRSNLAAVAKAQFRRAVELTQFVASEAPGLKGARQNLIEAHLQLGRAHGFANELAEAEAWFGTTRDLAGRWAADDPSNSRAGFFLAFAIRKLADTRKLNHDLTGARPLYLEAIRIDREILAAEPANVEYKQHLAVALHDLGGTVYRQHEATEARRLFQEAEGLLAELTRFDPDDEEALFYLVAVRRDSGWLEKDESRFVEAAAAFRRALEMTLQMREKGMLRSFAPLPAGSLDALKQELADSEDAPVALGDLDAIRARPPAVAIRLLLTRSRILAERGDGPGLTEAMEALRDFDGGSASDRYAQARGLGLGLGHLGNGPLRASCADRAVTLLGQSVELGLSDLDHLDHDASLASLRDHPAFESLRERLRARAPR